MWPRVDLVFCLRQRLGTHYFAAISGPRRTATSVSDPRSSFDILKFLFLICLVGISLRIIGLCRCFYQVAPEDRRSTPDSTALNCSWFEPSCSEKDNELEAGAFLGWGISQFRCASSIMCTLECFMLTWKWR